MLLQLEAPIEHVISAVELGNKYGVTIILDPTPAQKLPENIYSQIDYLLPNEGEMKKYLEDYYLPTTESKIEKLLGFGL